MKWLNLVLLVVVVGCGKSKTDATAPKGTNIKTENLHLFVPDGSQLSSNEIVQLTTLAESNGDRNAALRLADYFGFVNFNVEKEIRYLTIAATNGVVTAQYNLGMIYLTVPRVKDVNSASNWFERASESGDADARQRLEEIRKMQN